MLDIRKTFSKRYPEIERFDSPEAAYEAMQAWYKELMTKPKHWLACAGIVCGAIFCGFGLLALVRWWIDVPPSMHPAMALGIVGGCFSVAVRWFWRRKSQRFLRERLIGLGMLVCLKCGYDLRGQTEPRCPECGIPFDPALIQE